MNINKAYTKKTQTYDETENLVNTWNCGMKTYIILHKTSYKLKFWLEYEITIILTKATLS